jgi:extracellular sulfatase Sulf
MDEEYQADAPNKASKVLKNRDSKSYDYPRLVKYSFTVNQFTANQQDPFDNNLPSSPYKSKFDRLNEECSDPTLLQDCIAGQKWKCVNEGGRWRKHKCKFHLQLQNHLAQISKILSAQQLKKNCACFTPNGVVYTKLKNERDPLQSNRRSDNGQNFVFGRHKRDIMEDDEDLLNEIYNDQLSQNMLDLIQLDKAIKSVHNHIVDNSDLEIRHSRKKRESTDYITSVIDELHNVLENIEKKFKNQKLEKNGTLPGPAQCFVETTGQVNCSDVVYEDEKAWKKSRVQVDLLIRVLKNKINNLKEIKKHLKEHRPANLKDYEEDLENTSVSQEELTEKEEEDLEEVETTKKPKKTTHHHRHQHQLPNGGRRKKPKENVDEEGPLIDMSYFTTEHIETSTGSTTMEVTSTTQKILKTTTQKSTVATTKAPIRHQKHRHRMNRTSSTSTSTTPKTTTTEESTTSMDLTDDFSGFSSFSTTNVPESNLDIFPVNELEESSLSPALVHVTSEVPSTTTLEFNEDSVNVETTIIEPKHRHHKNFLNSLFENENRASRTNLTNEFPQYQSNRNSNRKQTISPADCYCEPEIESTPNVEKEIEREARKKLKEERQKKKERKRNKKARIEKDCLSERMNCFSHDSNHWRTEPFWTDVPFCFCMNANNNTYSCIRTINTTHNFLYCEFTTGIVTYYDLKNGEMFGYFN